jgi:hypothetical protein
VASAAAAVLRCVAPVAAVHEAAATVRSASLQKIDLELAVSRLLEQLSVQIDGLTRVRLCWSGIWTGSVLRSSLDFLGLVTRGRN